MITEKLNKMTNMENKINDIILALQDISADIKFLKENISKPKSNDTNLSTENKQTRLVGIIIENEIRQGKKVEYLNMVILNAESKRLFVKAFSGSVIESLKGKTEYTVDLICEERLYNGYKNYVATEVVSCINEAGDSTGDEANSETNSMYSPEELDDVPF